MSELSSHTIRRLLREVVSDALSAQREKDEDTALLPESPFPSPTEYTDEELKFMREDVDAMIAISDSAMQTLSVALKDMRAAQMRVLDIARIVLCEKERAAVAIRECIRAHKLTMELREQLKPQALASKEEGSTEELLITTEHNGEGGCL